MKLLSLIKFVVLRLWFWSLSNKCIQHFIVWKWNLPWLLSFFTRRWIISYTYSFFFSKPNKIRMRCLRWWKDSYWCTSIPNEKGPLIHTRKRMFWKNMMQICLLSQKFMSKLLITAIWGKSLTPLPMVGKGSYSMLIILRGNDPKSHESFNWHLYFFFRNKSLVTKFVVYSIFFYWK